MAAETPIHAAAATEAAGHAAASGGLPQFDFQWWPGQIVWVLLVFLVLFIYMRAFAVPKLGGAIAARDAKIEGDLADARALKDQADVTAAEAADERAQARAAAQKLAGDARAAARDQAMTNVASIAQETAAAIVAKLTGKTASAAELSAVRARG